MAKRYCLSPIVQVGLHNANAPKTQTHGVSGVQIIPTGANGQPLFPWCLVLISATNLSGVVGDVEIDTLPDLSLDSTLGVLSNQERNRVTNALTKYGVNTTGINNSTTFREVIRRVGLHLSPGFDENNFDVA